MHPKGGIPPPQGSSNTVEQMFGAGSGVLVAPVNEDEILL